MKRELIEGCKILVFLSSPDTQPSYSFLILSAFICVHLRFNFSLSKNNQPC